jgi:hypothetical protein
MALIAKRVSVSRNHLVEKISPRETQKEWAASFSPVYWLIKKIFNHLKLSPGYSIASIFRK